MTRETTPSGTGPASPTPGGALARVVEAERAAARELERARTEARRVLEEARERVARREDRLEAELRAERARIESGVEAWRQTEIARVREEGEREARRYRRASVVAVRRMARRILRESADGAPAPPRRRRARDAGGEG